MKYTRITPISGSHYEDCPEELETVRIIHQLHSQGESLGNISRKLAQKGIYTRKGKPYARSTIAIICHKVQDGKLFI